MKLITLSASVQTAILLGLKLQETATEVEVQTAVQGLITLAATQKTQIETLTTEKETAQGSLTKAENALAENIKLANTAKVAGLIKLHQDAGKFLAGAAPAWTAAAEKDFAGTEALLLSMPGSTTLAQTLDKEKGEVWYAKLNYSQMDKGGQLVKLKAENLEVFKAKYQEHFGSEYKG